MLLSFSAMLGKDSTGMVREPQNQPLIPVAFYDASTRYFFSPSHLTGASKHAVQDHRDPQR